MSNKKLFSLKLVILGEKLIGKSPLINDYLSLSKGISQLKNENYAKISFIKQLSFPEEFKIQIQVRTFSEKNDKNIMSAINESHCALILFDMGSRISVENMYEEWIFFLRNTCNYKGLVFIFGKHLDEKKLLKTDDEEINEMIKMSEVECGFYNIADKKPEEINKIIDELIVNSVENAKNNMNKKDCIIF